MSRREAVLSALVVFAIALVVRVAVASTIVFPKPEDTAYYVGVARNLVEGRGMVSDALWSYGTEPLRLPRDAFEVWLPLPTLIAAIPVALVRGAGPIPLDVAFRAAQLTSVLIGALVAALAWRVGADVARERRLPPGRARTLAIGTGVTAAVYLPLVLHSALPDSTMPFAALALGAALLMARIVRDPRGARIADPRVVALGLVIGLAALTRNEAAWLALVWVVLVLGIPAAGPAVAGGSAARGSAWPARIRLIGTVAVVSFAVFAPWAYRDWQVFGSPLPGQALTNAFSIEGFDIFAWSDPPTLSRYLAVGPTRLLEMRAGGVGHNLWNVLLSVGMPISLVGLLALPWQGLDRALRPLLLIAIVTFLVTSLVFPVSTTWGTFLHAAGPAHILLIVSGLGALDALIAAVGRRRAWHRPVAWLGPSLAVFGSALFSITLLPTFAGASAATGRMYAALDQRLAAVGVPADPREPIIHDYPIWLAETGRRPAIALPQEPPASVIDLARFFGARWLVVSSSEGIWPHVLDSGAPGSDCFREVDLGVPSDPVAARDLAGTRLYRLACLGDDTVHRP